MLKGFEAFVLSEVGKCYLDYDKKSLNELRALVIGKFGDYPDEADKDDLIRLLRKK